MLSLSDALHQFPYTPYMNATTSAFFGLCGEDPTLATSPHYTTTRPTDIHTYSAMDSGGDRLTHPASRRAQFLVRQRSFVLLRPSGSSRMVEASQLETTVVARRSTHAPAPPPVAERAKKPKPGAPPQIQVCTDVWLHARGLTVMC